ncbi:MAG TPA: thermonuclease family protein [bacterium]|nr:thermonuclease family protein [bacterium]HQO35969.1 thermonuclease family protein [bacterium]HQP98436.1 thermonuclease family protein [bacterium]
MRRYKKYTILAVAAFTVGLFAGRWTARNDLRDLDRLLSEASDALDTLPRGDLERLHTRLQDALSRLAELDWRNPSGSETRTETTSQEDSLSAVLKIVDGDTLDVRYQGRTERIRMLCINTPERNQRGYEEATDALHDLVEGKSVRLEFEESGKEARDVYGRLLAYLFVGDLNVNTELVRQGWSKHFTKYGRGKYAEQFESAEQEAQSAKRGVWGL